MLVSLIHKQRLLEEQLHDLVHLVCLDSGEYRQLVGGFDRTVRHWHVLTIVKDCHRPHLRPDIKLFAGFQLTQLLILFELLLPLEVMFQVILDKKDPAACEERSVLVLMKPVRHCRHVLLELVKDLAEARPDWVNGGVLRQHRTLLLQLIQQLILQVAIEDTSLLQLDEELLLGRQWRKIRPV